MIAAGRALDWWRVCLSALVLLCGNAHALSIGSARVQSYIGEPLSVVVPVQGQGRGELRAWLQPPAADQQSSFAQVIDTTLYEVVVDTAVTPAVVRIMGTQPQREPVLQMMLQLGQGELSMGFLLNILLDPSPPVRASPVPAPPTTPTRQPRRQPQSPPTISVQAPTSAPAAATLQGNRPIVPAAKAAGRDRSPAKVQKKPKAPQKPTAPGLHPGTQAIFLKPGMFALQTEFSSYREQRAQEMVGVTRIQQGEPERFQADWILSVEALSGAAAGSVQPAPSGDDEEYLSEETIAEPAVVPTQEIELTLPRGALEYAGLAQPAAGAMVRVTPAPAVTAVVTRAPVVAEPVATAQEDGVAEEPAPGSGYTRPLLWALLAAILGALLWKRRADQDVVRVDYSAAEAEQKLPPIVFPADVEEQPARRAHDEFTAPDLNLNAELRALREKIRKLRATGELSESQLRELQVAEVMLKHNRIDAAERILETLA